MEGPKKKWVNECDTVRVDDVGDGGRRTKAPKWMGEKARKTTTTIT